MDPFLANLKEAERFLRSRLQRTPRVAVVFGTGLGEAAEALQIEGDLPYREIPHHPVSTVESHQGRWLWGRWGGRPVVALQGRFHLYEGYNALEISFPIRLLAALGVRTLLLSNAVGGLNPLYQPGDLMLIHDHINFTGHNPLVGPNLEAFGVRFPDMVEPYSRRLRELALEAALEHQIRLHQGVYVGVLGPSLETAAETRMLRQWGADAVGMSTIMEVISAVHAGMEVMAVSAVSNINLPDCYQPATLEQVIANAAKAGPALMKLFSAVIGRL